MTEQKLLCERLSKGKTVRKRRELIFLIVLLGIPTLHWFIFWLYVNMSSFALAFKTQTGEWSLLIFRCSGSRSQVLTVRRSGDRL